MAFGLAERPGPLAEPAEVVLRPDLQVSPPLLLAEVSTSEVDLVPLGSRLALCFAKFDLLDEPATFFRLLL